MRREKQIDNEELVKLLVDISKQLKDITSSIDRYLDTIKPVEINIEKIKGQFPPNLREQLVFDETSQYLIFRPKGYLDTEVFAKIASIIRDQLGGEYISAGKESHFRVRKTRKS